LGPATFSGTYVITGGTGRFSSATGTGAISGAFTPTGTDVPVQTAITGSVQP
jgi:hypothetical protein